MAIKETRHPAGMIDLTIVPRSIVADKYTKIRFNIPQEHHVLIVDMGGCD